MQLLRPEETFGGFLEDLFRYRIGVLDQEMRVREAAQRALGTRAAVLERADELLFSPEPHESVMDEYARLEVADRPEVWRLRNEVQFLLVAIRGVYLSARALARVVTDAPHEGVVAALASFEEDVPDAIRLRNIHEHMDEYLVGGGRERLPQPEFSAIGLPGDGPIYIIGGRLFHVGQITAAAKLLGDAVAEAVRPVATD